MVKKSYWTFLAKPDSVKKRNWQSWRSWINVWPAWDDTAIVLNYNNNAILEITGSGGTEAQDWGDMLLRMYTRFGNATALKLKSWTIRLEMRLESSLWPYLWRGLMHGLLKWNGGSPFGSDLSTGSAKRRHTSLHLLRVMPELDDTIEVEVRDDDIKMGTFRSGGRWTKTSTRCSGVRLSHIPTGDCSGIHRGSDNTGTVIVRWRCAG